MLPLGFVRQNGREDHKPAVTAIPLCMAQRSGSVHACVRAVFTLWFGWVFLAVPS